MKIYKLKIMSLLILSICFILKTNSQNYNINFVAAGSATSVTSVEVKNLTQGISLTMLGTDILHLGAVGINEITLNNENIEVSPNPINEQTELKFYAKQSGITQLVIYDISGKEIIKTADNLSKGVQKYQLSGLKQGFYILNISSENYFYTSKLISKSNNQTDVKIKRIETEKYETPINIRKSTKSSVNMAYNSGDILLFKGTSSDYKTIVTAIPTADTTITFNFYSCNDLSNNHYSIVKIGSQFWMAENLKTRYYSGAVTDNSITYIDNDNTWAQDTLGAYCNYNNLESNADVYGRLYNWYAVHNTRKICPQGWHVPSAVEWSTMYTLIGGTSIAAGILKESGTTHWATPNSGATNKVGFTALPGGQRNNQVGNYQSLGSGGGWWTDTEVAAFEPSAMLIGMWSDAAYLLVNEFPRSGGFSVRCVKD